jgi:hypothetical protein
MSILIKLNQIDSNYLVEISNDKEEMIYTSDTGTTQDILHDTVSYSKTAHQIQKTAHIPTVKQREMDTFMKDNYQYYRIGEVYGKIAPNNTIEKISRSCFYSNRTKAGYGKK